jgi:hypothetical protein
VRQRDDDGLDIAWQERSQLAYAFVVGSIAAPDDNRLAVEPHDVAPLEVARRLDFADHRSGVEPGKCVPLSGRLRRTLRLSHAAQDEAVVADDRRIPHVDGIKGGACIPRQKMHLGARGLKELEKRVVLGDRTGEIRGSRVTELPPLRRNRGLVNKRVAGMLQDDAGELAELARHGDLCMKM